MNMKVQISGDEALQKVLCRINEEIEYYSERLEDTINYYIKEGLEIAKDIVEICINEDTK